MTNPAHKGLPLEYLRAKRASIVAEWREVATPCDETIAKWAKQVSDINTCIVAMEAALAER